MGMMGEPGKDWPLYTGALSFTLRAPDREDAEKRMKAMIGAAKNITPEDFRLEVKGAVTEAPAGPETTVFL